MKILKYEKDKKDTYNVFLSNGEVLTLSESVITQNELLLKKEIDKDLYDKLNSDNRLQELLTLATKYLSIRLRSEKEIATYLLKKNASQDEISSIIQKLKSWGYLDDAHFTEAYIKDKLNFTTFGDYKIKNELGKLGVSKNIIEEKSFLLADDILKERITKIIEKDLQKNKKYSSFPLRNKIYNHLLTQGYRSSLVTEVLNNYHF